MSTQNALVLGLNNPLKGAVSDLFIADTDVIKKEKKYASYQYTKTVSIFETG